MHFLIKNTAFYRKISLEWQGDRVIYFPDVPWDIATASFLYVQEAPIGMVCFLSELKYKTLRKMHFSDKE